MSHRGYWFLRIGLIACCICFQNFPGAGSARLWAQSLPKVSFAAFGSDGLTHIYRLSHGKVRQLTSGAHNDTVAEWSFDRTRIVFQRDDSNGAAVYVMNADGTGLKRLSPTPGRDVVPAFSADGKQVVFSSVVSFGTCNGGPTLDIMSMNSLNGQQRTILVDGTKADTCFNVEPRYAPNGSTIAFDCGPYNGTPIQVCLVNPHNLTAILHLTGAPNTVAADPHWSWDSSKLAISYRDTNKNVNVWTIDADGSNLTQVTKFVEPVEGGDAGWSPDDSQLVFEHDDGGKGQSVATVLTWLGLIHADGSGLTALSDRASPLPIPCTGIGCAPRFKPPSQ